eukprot:TRINITY_DN6241_c0_g2_i1.p1 TRINITY_DN6241_c0_g2~~TRINITY_DN6241_c0_g2_i1.p1  ORF type:complete len:901 (+),score=172.91 TRINITY_DN6241_c0_g2_i1:317-2704(+)
MFQFMEELHFDVVTLGPTDWDDLTGLLINETIALWISNRSYAVTVTSYDLSLVPSLDHLIPRYHIKIINNTKVGFLGISVLGGTTSNSYPKDMNLVNSIKAVQYGVSVLLTLDVDVIILMVNNDPFLAETRNIIQTVPGIDAVVLGRVKLIEGITVYSPSGDKVPIAYIPNGKDLGISLGRLDLSFDTNGKLLSHQSQLILLNDTKTSNYTEYIKTIVLRKYQEALNMINTEYIGNSVHLLPGKDTLAISQETALGNLLTDAMRIHPKNVSVDISFLNSGAIREDLSKGNITIADIYKILPFPNVYVLMKVSGMQILQALLNSVSVANNSDPSLTDTTGRFLQMSGIKFSWNPDVDSPLIKIPGPGTDRYVPNRICDIQILNQFNQYVPIDLKKNYTVAMNDYLAQGGDFYQCFLSSEIIQNSVSFQNIIIEYISWIQQIRSEVEGRVTNCIVPKDWLAPPEDTPKIALYTILIIFFCILVFVMFLVILFCMFRRKKNIQIVDLGSDILNKFYDATTAESRGFTKESTTDSQFYYKKISKSDTEYDIFDKLKNILDFRDIVISKVYAVIPSTTLVSGFSSHKDLMEQRKKQKLFSSKDWQNIDPSEKSQWVYDQFEQLLHQSPLGARDIIPAVHGTSGDIGWNIIETGFASLATLDAGFYGKGIYFSTSASYITPYFSTKDHPTILICLTLPGNPFPVTDKSYHGKPIRNGYQSHYVRTFANGFVCDDPKQPSYDEIVLEHHFQVLPMFVVLIDKDSIPNILAQFSREVFNVNEEALLRKKTSRFVSIYPVEENT